MAGSQENQHMENAPVPGIVAREKRTGTAAYNMTATRHKTNTLKDNHTRTREVVHANVEDCRVCKAQEGTPKT